MFIKKIVSWISENPPNGSGSENFVDEVETTLNESSEAIQTDNWSSTSTCGKTSTLDGSIEEQAELDNIQRCNKEKGENLFADGDIGSRSITNSDNTDSSTRIESKGELTDYQSVQNRLPLIRNSVANFKLSDDVAIKRDTTDFVTAFSSTANYKSLPYYKAVSDSEHRTSSAKSIFTQTKVGVDKNWDKVATKDSNNSSSFDVLEQKNRLFPVSESSLARYTEKHGKLESSESLYGTLFVVGCSKVIPTHLTKKMNTKYVLRKRAKANGLIEASSFSTSDVAESLSASSSKHVISYPSGNNRSVIVTFRHDSLSDMFQIGRYEKYPIDFTVDDTNPQDKARHGVSRFACRINVRRDQNHETRIYAGAFNSSLSIFVGGIGLAHEYSGKMDGFTTNGVLILKPDEDCTSNWREVSVSGYIYPLRSSKMDVSKRPRISEESNVLIDGTLIDLCGVTLIWRTPEGLKKTPTEHYLNRLQTTLHKYAPECTLISRNSNMLISQSEKAIKRAYIYLSCGHVVGLTLSKLSDDYGKGWSCPVCRAIGPIKEFTIGSEPGFYFHEEVPTYAAFKPCGHVATQKTVDFWSSIDIPNHRNIHFSICPFCGQKLNFITKCVKLKLPII